MEKEFTYNSKYSTSKGFNLGGKKVFFSKTSLRLLSYFKQQYKLLVLVFVCLVISVFCNILSPYLLGIAIDECVSIAQGINVSIDFHQLTILLIQFVTLNVISSIGIWCGEYCMAIASQRIAKNLGEVAFNKLNKLKINYFDSTQRGNILSYFSNDIELIKESMGATFVQLLSGGLTLIGAIIIMCYISPLLTLISAITLPFVIILSRFIISKTRKYFQQQQEAISSLNGMVEESLNGLSVIQSFVNEENVYQQFKLLNESVRKSGIKSQIYSGILMPLMRVMDSLGYILTTVFGALFVIKGYISIGNVQSFFLYVKNFQRPIFTLMSQLNNLQSGLVGAERIFRLLDEDKEENSGQKLLLDKYNVKGEIEFNNLHFGYTPTREILKGISFKVNPGEVVAIVGTTGAGKSTLFNLLSGMYDYEEGSIKIDGCEIKELPRQNLRSVLGIVQQEPIIFSETLRFNIAYGLPEATDEEIWGIIDLTHSKHLIERLPNGYNQHLQNLSGRISQGQRQLLTIARAFLPNARILLLDEATSNLDTRSEALLQKALNKLIKNRTCLIIAHRLSTVKNADKILVLDKGVIAEVGTHNELLQRKGIYHDIYTSQFAIE